MNLNFDVLTGVFVGHYGTSHEVKTLVKEKLTAEGLLLSSMLDGSTGVLASTHLCIKLNSLYEIEEVGENTPCCMTIGGRRRGI